MKYPQLGFSEAPRGESWARGPAPKSAHILDRTKEHMNSVPYRVSLRWLFYRLLQDGTLQGKDSYDSFKGLIATARHSGVIHPAAIADEGRQTLALGGAFETVSDWRDELAMQLGNGGYKVVDTMRQQDTYIIVAFEARAMASQFEVYAAPYDVTLYPFGGDPSIPFKWNLATHCSRRLAKVQDVTLLYFGDLDPKGDQIGETAIRHVRKWIISPPSGVAIGKFNAYRVGLLARHITQYEITEQFDKPGHYQWEALTDSQAAEIITSALEEFCDKEKLEECQSQEREQLESIAEVLEEWTE